MISEYTTQVFSSQPVKKQTAISDDYQLMKLEKTISPIKTTVQKELNDCLMSIITQYLQFTCYRIMGVLKNTLILEQLQIYRKTAKIAKSPMSPSCFHECWSIGQNQRTMNSRLNFTSLIQAMSTLSCHVFSLFLSLVLTLKLLKNTVHILCLMVKTAEPFLPHPVKDTHHWGYEP